MPTTLGIETSCDETAIAIIESDITHEPKRIKIINSMVHSQAVLHSQYGGVFPTLAKREHSKNLLPLLERSLSGLPADMKALEISEELFKEKIIEIEQFMGQQNSDLYEIMKGADFLKHVPRIDNIAVTEGPGLEPTLWVGINFARALGILWNKKVIAINHMEGHIVGSLIADDKAFGIWQELKAVKLPALALLISGGHTELVLIEKNTDSRYTFKYNILGQTKDDAVGEAFDKVARLLGLPYPGGPQISLLAEKARKNNVYSKVKLPRPMINSNDLNFSFSGLKTAVLYATRKADEDKTFNDEYKMALAREFEDSVVEVLAKKLSDTISGTRNIQSLIVGGGVSANTAIRTKIQDIANENNIPLYLPQGHISGDNALMIALAEALHGSDDMDRSPKADGTKKLA